uniref:Uncharacterized protein LOC111121500 n=1 Tax=Crassostrea virginica TaxID=6565 RepID=A0A8B8CVM6_CRAVI|nr:uncharacterized protein LOC111121500 [Crassostrea virginica]
MDNRLDVGRPGLFSDTVSSGDRILAPFWSDIDLTEGSRVWYHLYQDDGSLGVRNYLSQAKAFIVQNILYPEGEREAGDPNTLLVVTWERVVPAPRALSPTKNATFQLLVLSDGITTYTAFLYDAVHWDTTRPTVVGFHCGGQTPYTYSLPASLSPAVHSVVTKQGYNRHNVSGVWIYRLDSCSEGPPRNDRARCHTWLQSDRVREQPQVSQADSLLPPCPCNTVQVAMDTNFVQSRTESNCYFFHPPPVNTNYTRKCCYSSYGSLLFATLGAGYVFLNSPLVLPAAVTQESDILPYTWCCVKAHMCEQFFIQRPSDNCYTYSPVSTAAVSPLISYYPLRLMATVGEMVDITALAQGTGDELVSLILTGSITANITKRGMAAMLYRWTPRDTSPKFIQIYAMKPNSLVSATVTPDIILCPGCGGHGSCDFEGVLPQPQPSFFLVECVCDPGWTGANCNVDQDGCANGPCNSTSQCRDLTPSVQQAQGLSYQCSSCRLGYALSSSLTCIDVDECSLSRSPCSQGCVNMDGSFLCTCLQGYRLDDQQCIDVDECSEGTSGCEQGCVNTLGSYYCVCSTGYQLQTDRQACQQVFVETACINKQCQQGCRLKSSGEPECFCNLGYTMLPDSSCEEINECLAGICPQTCQNQNGSVECGCYHGYTLQADRRSCAACDIDHWGLDCNMSCDCSHHSLRCDNAIGCICGAGWTGRFCESNINECEEPGLCAFPEVCRDTPGSYTCSCAEGYQRNSSGTPCQYYSACSSWAVNACGLEEDCVDTVAGYSCVCTKGFRRVNQTCQDLDECTEMVHTCHHDCVNTWGSFRCVCKPGYMLQLDGETCVPLDSNPCMNNPRWTTCDHNFGGCTVNERGDPRCFCRQGYSPVQTDNFTRCNDIQECWLGVSGCSHGCVNTMGGFTCICPSGLTLSSDNKTCCDALGRWGDNCMESCGCGQGALRCDALLGCVCRTGWTGPHCSQRTLDCSSRACGPNQKCVNVNLTDVCVCQHGFQRDDNNQCQDIDECSTGSNSCTQRCVNTLGSHHCACTDGFQLAADNRTCLDEDECKQQTSLCHQKCLNTIGGYYCLCYEGFHLSGSSMCIKDDGGSACGGLDAICQYGCRVDGSRAFCFCPSGYTLNPDHTTCSYVNSTVNVRFVTEIDFQSEYNNPSSAQYKNLKRDMKTEFGSFFSHINELKSVQILRISENCTIFDVRVKFSRDLSQDLDAALNTALERVQQSGVEFQGQQFAVIEKPTVSVPFTPAPCLLCLANQKCRIQVNSNYICRTLLVNTTNVTRLKITIEKAYEGYMADTLDRRYAVLEDAVLTTLSSMLNLTIVQQVQLDSMIAVSTGTQMRVSVLLREPPSSAFVALLAHRLQEMVERLGCISLGSSCVALLRSTTISHGTEEAPVPCKTCAESEACIANSQGIWSCQVQTSSVDATTTTASATVALSTVRRPASQDTQILVGVGIAVPLGVIFLIFTVALTVLLCRKWQYWNIHREASPMLAAGHPNTNVGKRDRINPLSRNVDNRDRVMFRQPILPMQTRSPQGRLPVPSGGPPSYPRLYPILDQQGEQARPPSRIKDEFVLQRPLVDPRPSNLYQS